jgi:hypothetical protein
LRFGDRFSRIVGDSTVDFDPSFEVKRDVRRILALAGDDRGIESVSVFVESFYEVAAFQPIHRVPAGGNRMEREAALRIRHRDFVNSYRVRDLHAGVAYWLMGRFVSKYSCDGIELCAFTGCGWDRRGLSAEPWDSDSEQENRKSEARQKPALFCELKDHG